MEFWKEESSLYQIIKDHLDQEGYFDPDLIEDQNFVDTYAVLFREPGTSDSYMASMPDRPQEEVGSVIAGALAAYAKIPTPRLKRSSMLPSRAFHLLSIMIILSTCCPRRKSLTPFGTFAIAGSIMPLPRRS